MAEQVNQKPRILVVEDEAIIGMNIEEMLQDAGYEVAAIAVSAPEALLAADLSRPDLILMDIHIRGDLDGVEVANRIRSEHNLPVIFLTGHADPATLERARVSEPFGYLVKPITPLSLSSSIEMALYKSRMEQKLEEHRAWLSTVLQSMPDAVLVTDMDGKTAFLNAAASRLTGTENIESLGEPLTKVLQLGCPDYTELTQQLVTRCLDGAGDFELPAGTTLTRCDGSGKIQITGQITLSYIGQRSAGAVFTLREQLPTPDQPPRVKGASSFLAIGQFLSALARLLFSLTRLHF